MASLTRPLPWTYDVDHATGRTYQTNPRANWARTEAPRLTGPRFAPRAPKIMRDPTDMTTHAATGGTPRSSATGMRNMVPPRPTPAARPQRRSVVARVRGRK